MKQEPGRQQPGISGLQGGEDVNESHPTYRVYPPRRTQSVLVCPTCKVPVQVTHQFQTADGVTIATTHCREHGEVVPMRSALVNFIADQPQPVWDGEGP